jgi:hypothetical protein
MDINKFFSLLKIEHCIFIVIYNIFNRNYSIFKRIKNYVYLNKNYISLFPYFEYLVMNLNHI